MNRYVAARAFVAAGSIIALVATVGAGVKWW
jgi:hypothetical protein